jgi:hypothetical protein
LALKVKERIGYYQDLHAEDYRNNDIDQHGHGLLQKWECYTMTRPKKFATATFLVLHLLFCFLLPFAFLCWTKNVAGVLTFVAMGFMHFQQTSLDSIQIVEELGSLAFGKQEDAEVKCSLPTNRQRWISRLFHIHSLNGYRDIWSRALGKNNCFDGNCIYSTHMDLLSCDLSLGTFVWLFVAVAVAALFASRGNATEMANSSSDKLDPWMTFPISTFIYKEPQTMNQPTCSLDTINSSSMKYLADYAFLGMPVSLSIC